jgi:hypothetical protein
VPEAAGVEAILSGVRASGADDDQVLTAMTAVLDALYTALDQGTSAERTAMDRDRRRTPTLQW